MHRLQLTFLFVLQVLLANAANATRAEERRSFLAADSSKNRIAIIGEDGSTVWEHSIGPLHDLHHLDNGHVLFQTSWTHVVEYDIKNQKVVWEYDSKSTDDDRVEIHAFERLANGSTMVVESGRSTILELSPTNDVLHRVKLKVSKPDAHRDTRLVRKLSNGNYLVCHEGDGLVREYNRDGSTAWEFPIPLFGKEPAPGHGIEAFGNQCFAALRLENGNTLISTGNGHSIIEVTPTKEIAWKLDSSDLDGIQLAWLTTLQVLPSGNIVFGNCHAGPNNPQIIEVTRDKQVVWSFHDFERFGDSLTNTQVLSVNGKGL